MFTGLAVDEQRPAVGRCDLPGSQRRGQLDAMLAVMAALAHEIDVIDCELRRLAKTERD